MKPSGLPGASSAPVPGYGRAGREVPDHQAMQSHKEGVSSQTIARRELAAALVTAGMQKQISPQQRAYRMQMLGVGFTPATST